MDIVLLLIITHTHTADDDNDKKESEPYGEVVVWLGDENNIIGGVW